MDQKPLLYIAAIFAYLLAATGCANIVAPTGGPRDSLPPVLLGITPKDSALNFTGNRISFTFNEYVEIQNLQENLIVSPTPKVNPLVEYKLRTVTIKLKDTLEKNTTYAINLGNSLRDINEGNVYKNFTYVFSTGDTLDQYTFSGKVRLAETGKTDSTLVVLLHRSGEDSAVANERPRYFAKLDSSGLFHFRFLAPGTYHLYALKDEGGMKRYTSEKQVFAFADKPVVIGAAENAPPVTLYAYTQKESESDRKKPGIKPAAATRAGRKEKEEDKRLRFQLNLDNGQQNLLGDLQLSFNDSLKSFDSSKVAFTDEEFNIITDYTITKDSTGKVYTIRYPWKENTAYNLILDKEFASDTLDRKLLKTDTLPFKTKKNSDYGTLKLRFRNIDLTKKPVLEVVLSDKIILSYPFTGATEYYVKLFNPGEYDLRILYDTNGNGTWDAGEFFGKHLQPERVISIEKKLKVRANWDNEENITLITD